MWRTYPAEMSRNGATPQLLLKTFRRPFRRGVSTTSATAEFAHVLRTAGAARRGTDRDILAAPHKPAASAAPPSHDKSLRTTALEAAASGRSAELIAALSALQRLGTPLSHTFDRPELSVLLRGFSPAAFRHPSIPHRHILFWLDQVAAAISHSSESDGSGPNGYSGLSVYDYERIFAVYVTAGRYLQAQGLFEDLRDGISAPQSKKSLYLPTRLSRGLWNGYLALMCGTDPRQWALRGRRVFRAPHKLPKALGLLDPLDVVAEMVQSGAVPNAQTYELTILSLGFQRDTFLIGALVQRLWGVASGERVTMREAQPLERVMPKQFVVPKSSTLLALVHAYSVNGQLERLFQCLDRFAEVYPWLRLAAPRNARDQASFEPIWLALLRWVWLLEQMEYEEARGAVANNTKGRLSSEVWSLRELSGAALSRTALQERAAALNSYNAAVALLEMVPRIYREVCDPERLTEAEVAAGAQQVARFLVLGCKQLIRYGRVTEAVDTAEAYVAMDPALGVLPGGQRLVEVVVAAAAKAGRRLARKPRRAKPEAEEQEEEEDTITE